MVWCFHQLEGGGGLVQATRHLISSYEISNFLLEYQSIGTSFVIYLIMKLLCTTLCYFQNQNFTHYDKKRRKILVNKCSKWRWGAESASASIPPFLKRI